jgi:hypothetical protein
MAIDYQKVLENPEVLAWAQAACPDYQDNVESDGEAYAKEQLEDWLMNNLLDRADQVLCLAWDGDFPGNSGALYVQEAKGMFFISSSDYEPSGPYQSVDEALEEDYFAVETANPELSGALPLEKLISIARGVCADSETISINDVVYGWKDGELVAVK